MLAVLEVKRSEIALPHGPLKTIGELKLMYCCIMMFTLKLKLAWYQKRKLYFSL